jgi:hypothetical protein
MDRWSRVVFVRTGNCGHPQTTAKFGPCAAASSQGATERYADLMLTRAATLLIRKGAMALDAVKTRKQNRRFRLVKSGVRVPLAPEIKACS